jgi:hypothetical protein
MPDMAISLSKIGHCTLKQIWGLKHAPVSPQHPFTVPPHRLPFNCLDARCTIDVPRHKQTGIDPVLNQATFSIRHFNLHYKESPTASTLGASIKLSDPGLYDRASSSVALRTLPFVLELPSAAAHFAPTVLCAYLLGLKYSASPSRLSWSTSS